jgi:AcrR family transcriptional regulator
MTRKAEIVEAAIALLDRSEKPGVVSVAREIGIQPPSLYKHFENGAALDAAVAEEGFRRLAARFEAADLKGAPRRRLEALLQLQRGFAKENSALYMHMSTTVIDNDAPASLALITRYFGLLSPFLDEIGLPSRDHVHAVRTLRAAVHGFIMLELSGQFRMPADVDVSFARLCRWLVDGLKGT